MDPAAAKELEVLSTLKRVDEATEKGNSTIQQFYEDAVVLVTGGSGFLGKQLIEKLLRSCNIKKIYILLRSKKGKTINQRMAKLLENPVFDSVRQKKPWFAERLVPIEGDVIDPKLGISEDIWHTLTEEVTIIFHSAATVNFKEALRTATLINVRGTIEMLKLGKACRNLRSFVHVSTAFSHATRARQRSEVLEEFYPSPLPPTTLVELAEHIDGSTLEGMTSLFKQERNNSYVFTKAVAEEAIRIMSDDLPICIVRPAVVVCSYLEPGPGWVDVNSLYGPSGILLGLGTGVMHTLMADQGIMIDLVPVDLVNNGIIVAGWETATRDTRVNRDIKIYNVTAARNPIKWSYLTEVIGNDLRKYATPRALWYGFAQQTNNRYIFSLLSWILHFIPGAIVDGGLFLIGKKPTALKNYLMMYKLSSTLQYFLCNYWIFDDENFAKMTTNMSETDKKIFNIDITSVDMKQMIIMWFIGLRKYIIKDGLEGTKYSQKMQILFKIVTYLLGPLYLYLIYKFAYVFYSIFMLFVQKIVFSVVKINYIF